MPVVASADFTVHEDDCDRFDDGTPLSDLPDEVSSLDDFDCECWSAFHSLADVA